MVMVGRGCVVVAVVAVCVARVAPVARRAAWRRWRAARRRGAARVAPLGGCACHLGGRSELGGCGCGVELCRGAVEARRRCREVSEWLCQCELFPHAEVMRRRRKTNMYTVLIG